VLRTAYGYHCNRRCHLWNSRSSVRRHIDVPASVRDCKSAGRVRRGRKRRRVAAVGSAMLHIADASHCRRFTLQTSSARRCMRRPGRHPAAAQQHPCAGHRSSLALCDWVDMGAGVVREEWGCLDSHSRQRVGASRYSTVALGEVSLVHRTKEAATSVWRAGLGQSPVV